MIFDPLSGALYADDGSFLKTVYCPLALSPEKLSVDGESSKDRFCNACKKTVICIDQLTDKQVNSAVSSDPLACVFATPSARNITFLKPIGMAFENGIEIDPLIRSVRSLEAMNDAQIKGYKLVFRRTGEDYSFGDFKFILFQNNKTGALWWSGDFRDSQPPGSSHHEHKSPEADNEWTLIQGWCNLRPDRPFPLGAYLIPKNLTVNTRVFLEDVIEEIPLEYWNQGNAFRLVSSQAYWNGTDVTIIERELRKLVG
jgi:hypothetical protein